MIWIVVIFKGKTLNLQGVSTLKKFIFIQNL
jgi:hypothetical protein